MRFWALTRVVLFVAGWTLGNGIATAQSPETEARLALVIANGNYGGDDERFRNLIYSESEAAFIPWGDFGLNDVVLGTTAVTSIER